MADNAQAQQPQVQTQAPPQGQQPPPVRVSEISGGAGGTYAMLEELQALAKLTEDVGASLAIVRSQCHDVVIDGDVLMSAVLNPTGVAKFEATLLDAIDGPGGLTWLSAELQAHGPLLRKAAEAYRALDEGSEKVFDSVAWLTGYAGVGIGLASLPLLLGTLLNPVTGLPLIVAGSQVDWTKLLRDNPAVVQGIIRSLPGAVAAGQVALRVGLAGVLGPVGVALGPMVTGPIVTDVQSAAKLIGGLYPDGQPVVTHVSEVVNEENGKILAQSSQFGDDGKLRNPEEVFRVKSPPNGLDDTLEAYAYRNQQAQSKVDGQIDIREITNAAGEKVYIVNVPGTYFNASHPIPFQENKTLNDMSTNIHTLAGERTAYSQGIGDALKQVGYKPGSPIMLVGHSQGGMVAAQFASDPEMRERYNVTHVVTAGAPIGHVKMPPGVQALSIENDGDPVPKLDGRDNPAQSNWTTVKINSPKEGYIDNHNMGTVYRPTGSYLDSNTADPSVSAFRQSAEQFFNGSKETYHVKTITRNVPQ